MKAEQLRKWVRVRMKELRTATGMTNPAFAAAAHTSVSNIYKIEGEGNPTIETLHNWLTACGTTLPRFFALLITEADKKVIRDDQELFEQFELALLVPSRRDTIKAVLAGLTASER